MTQCASFPHIGWTHLVCRYALGIFMVKFVYQGHWVKVKVTWAWNPVNSFCDRYDTLVANASVIQSMTLSAERQGKHVQILNCWSAAGWLAIRLWISDPQTNRVITEHANVSVHPYQKSLSASMYPVRRLSVFDWKTILFYIDSLLLPINDEPP